ncbi:MAG: halocyanin domain-containing protein [Halapricum sp.]
MTLPRRRYLTLLGGAASAAIAGCGATGSVDRTTYDAPSTSVPDSATNFLADTSNFDGTAVDLTGRDTAEVYVGTKGNGGFFAFDPPAIEIASGTTVTWNWTGKGGAHNVAAKDGSFRSGPAKASVDTTFEHTFSESGVYPYFCTPHRMNGMKGVVVVK